MKKSIIFSNALAKVGEAKLLKKEQLIRLSDASSYEEALNMLYDYGYSRPSGDPKDLDLLIETQLDKLFEFIYENSPSEHLTTIILNPFLYNNAKWYYKSRFLVAQPSLYNIKDQHIKNGIENKDYSLLSLPMQECVKELDSFFEKNSPDGQVIDRLFNKAMFRDNLLAAKKSKEKQLKEYVITEIDFSNFISFLRSRHLKRPWEYCSLMLFDGGSINLGVFEQLYDSSEEIIKDQLATGRYSDLFLDILNNKVNLDISTDIILSDIELMELMNVTKLSPFLYFVKRQLIEFRVVRMLLTFIKNDAKDEIDKRIRGLYE